MFLSFKKRSTQSELMDDQHIGFNAFRDCLHGLAIVNVCSLGYRPTLNWLRQTLRWFKPERPISILDIGSGGGDMLRHIAIYAARRHQAVDLTGVDLNPWSKQYSDKVTPVGLKIEFETSDIFAFDPSRQADFVISSLFTHHLTDEQLVHFLQWMEQHATHGWFINDLHRHPIAYFFIKYASRLLGFHYMVQHDGPVSVARAFTKADWVKSLAAASVPMDQIEIRWFFPFRYGITRRKNAVA